MLLSQTLSILSRGTLTISILNDRITVRFLSLLLSLKVIGNMITKSVRSLRTRLIINRGIIGLRIGIITNRPLTPALNLSDLSRRHIVRIKKVITRTIISRGLLNDTRLRMNTNLLNTMLENSVKNHRIDQSILRRHHIIRMINIILLRTRTMTLYRINRLTNILGIMVTSLLNPANGHTNLASSGNKRKTTTLLRLKLRLEGRLLMLVNENRTTVNLLNASLVNSLKRIVLTAMLLGMISGVSHTTGRRIRQGGLTSLVKILNKISRRRIGTYLRINSRKLTNRLRNLILKRINIALLITLPQATIVTTRMMQTNMARLINSLLSINNGTHLIPAISMTNTRLIRVGLITTNSGRKQRVLILNGLRRNLGRIKTRKTGTSRNYIVTTVLRLRRTLGNLTSNRIKRFILLLREVFSGDSLKPEYKPCRCK